MKKVQLQTGMIVELRNGNTALVVKDNCYGEDGIVFDKDSWTGLSSYDENTLKWTFVSETPKFDIVKVYKPDLPTGFLGRKSAHRDGMELLWEETNTIQEYTMQEAIAKMGHDFKIIK